MLARFAPGDGLDAMAFMSASPRDIGGLETFVSRSGYTGEDGYEISLPAADAEALRAPPARSSRKSAPIGLGARDSLRLEAGLCLYGHELDETTDPVEAALAGRSRSAAAPKADFPARRASRRRLPKARRACASACARRPRAGARGRGDRRSRRTARASASSPRAASAQRRRADRDGLCRRGPRRAGTAVGLIVRGKRCRRTRRRRCRSIPTPITAAEAKEAAHVGNPLHQGPRIYPLDGAEGVVGISDHAQQQLGDVVFVEIPAVGKVVEGGRPGRGRRKREGGERGVRAGVGRSRRGQRRGRGDARA